MDPSLKRMLLVLAGVLTARAVSAQSSGSYVALGPIAGMAFSDRGGGPDEFAANTSRTSLAAGGFLEYGLSRHLALETQLWYIRGVGVDAGPLRVMARYELGLTKLTYRPESGNNRTVVLLAGLRFRFAR